MAEHIRVNVKALVNNAEIRHETRNGRKVVVVPSATLPDDIVMNRILYPSAEIEKSYQGLERTLAPFGHPKVNGRHVSAKEPEALNANHIGAHNENVRRIDGRVYMDKVIDIETATQSENGRLVLSAIEKNLPVHTSTGIFMQLVPNEDQSLRGSASNMVFDHDAILIGEDGAAGPDKGVGMMVNGEECEVVNSEVEDFLDYEMDHLGLRLMEVVDREEKNSRWAAIRGTVVEAIKMALQSSMTGNSLKINQEEETSMAISDKDFAELQESVKLLTTNASADTLAATVSEAVTSALAPLAAKVDSLEANAKASQDADRAKHTKILVDSGLLTEEDCVEMAVNSLKKLADKSQPKGAAPILGHFNSDESEDQKSAFSDVDLNANIDAAMGAKV
jgi:hypothetical protein